MGVSRTSPAHTASTPRTAALPSPGSHAGGYLSGPGKGLGHPAVPAPIAGGDQISHAATLQEGGRGHLALAEDPGKGDHFHEPQADDSGFGVVATAEAIAEPGSHGHDVLQRRKEARGCRHMPAGGENAGKAGTLAPLGPT